MTKNRAKWAPEHGQTENIGPSDGCRGNVVLLVAGSKYDFRELGAYLGNVGLASGVANFREGKT